MSKVFITRCLTEKCPAKVTCLRYQLPRRHHESKWDYDTERGNGRKCQGFIRFRANNVKAYC